MDNVLEKKFYIWGTGKISTELVGFIEKVNRICENIPELHRFVELKIDGFIDSDTNKQGGIFFDKNIISPDEYFTYLDDELCVIAVYKKESIEDEFNKRNINSDIYTVYTEYMNSIISFLSEYLDDIFSRFDNDYKTISELEKIGLWFRLIDDDVDIEYRYIYRQILGRRVNNIWIESCDSNILESMCKYIRTEDLIYSLSLADDKCILSICEAFYNGHLLNNKNNNIKTIGIYYPKLYGGGVQRFLSIIISKYQNMGYQVVIFTDESKSDNDYDIDDRAVRLELRSKRNNLYEYYKEWSKIIENYAIDLMCFHGLYGKKDYLDVLFCKMKGIPVLMEIHRYFEFYEKSDYILLKQAFKLIRCLDYLITVSSISAKYWSDKGCRCRYIPNPIESRSENSIGSDPYYEEGMILWAGRVTDEAKRVSDIVPIMKEVVRHYPKAYLNVVGSVDDNMKCKLNRLITNEMLSDNICLCGYSKEMQLYYKRACVMLMTSDSEGAPYVIVESKQYGVPIVMYELPSLDILKDNKGYKSVPQRDFSSAAKELVHILSDRNFRKKLSNEAKDSYRRLEEFDVEGAWKGIFNKIQCIK